MVQCFDMWVPVLFVYLALLVCTRGHQPSILHGEPVFPHQSVFTGFGEYYCKWCKAFRGSGGSLVKSDKLVAAEDYKFEKVEKKKKS